MSVLVRRWGKRPARGEPDNRPWAVVIRKNGKRRMQQFGSTEEDRMKAEEVASALREDMARAALGLRGAHHPLPIDEALRDWIDAYHGTMAHSTEETVRGLIEHWLIPFYGAKDFAELREADLLALIAHVREKGYSVHLARNALSALRRAASVAVSAGKLVRNPVLGIGRLLAGVARRAAPEAETRDAWTQAEVGKLLDVAASAEPRYYPYLLAAFHLGARRGELLGLRWEDLDLVPGVVHIRRARRAGIEGPPKSGKARTVPLSPALAAAFGEMRVRLRFAVRGPIFRSRKNTHWQQRTLQRAWDRIRLLAEKEGVRALPLHCARHTYATLALAAGRPPKAVSDELGHSLEVLLRHYAHVIPAQTDPRWDWLPGAADVSRHSSVSDAFSRRMKNRGDPGAIRTRDPQLRRLRSRSHETVADTVTSSVEKRSGGDATSTTKMGRRRQ